MTRLHRPRSRGPVVGRPRQQGAILIISLIMLVLVTLVSLTVIRSATVEERMAGNTRDRDKTFQATEAALRVCLARLLVTGSGHYNGTNPTVQMPTNAGTAQVWAADSAKWSSATDSAAVTEISASDYGLSASPRCIFEQLGSASSDSFRVTARGLGAQATTAVILQATVTSE